jgi:hypothetical protein
LHLDIYEERTVCKMLCELAIKEGLTFMENIKVAGKVMDKMTREFARRPPEVGIFEATYACTTEKED